jgi:hypothetical protein
VLDRDLIWWFSDIPRAAFADGTTTSISDAAAPAVTADTSISRERN